MENENVLTPDEEQVKVNEEVTVNTDDSEGAGHKVLFFVIMGIVCLSGIGIPVAAILIWKQHKKLKQYEAQFGKLPDKKAEPAPAEEPKTEDSKTETESK